MNMKSPHAPAAPLTKEMVMADPMALSNCFQRYAATPLSSGHETEWIAAITTAESICDQVLLSMSTAELFDVYARYLDQSPRKDFPFKESGQVFDSCMQSERADYYAMGLRELQSVACNRPDVVPFIKYAAVLPGPVGIENRRIQHLVGQVYGCFPGNVYDALKQAVRNAPLTGPKI